MRILRACCLALALCAAVAGPVMAQPAPPVVVPDASLAKGRQIVTNLKMFDLLMFGGRKGLLRSPDVVAMPKADQDRVIALFDTEMETRRAATVDAMATANSGRFTGDQLDKLVRLSQIKYIQDLVLAGGDASLATPDEASMTPAERALFYELMVQPWVGEFFTAFDYSTASPFITSAAQAALTRNSGG